MEKGNKFLVGRDSSAYVDLILLRQCNVYYTVYM